MTSDIESQAKPFFAFTDLGSLLSTLITAAIIVGALLALIFLLLGGVQWITSGGDAKNVEKAQHRITNAIIGLVLVASAYAIFTLVKSFLGLDEAISTP